MVMKVKKIIFCVSLALPIVANAESLSLLQAYHKAQAFDATIRAAQAENNAQKEEVNKAFAAFLPQARISANESRSRTESETPGPLGGTRALSQTYNSYNYSFSVRQSIFNKANFAEYNQSKAVVQRSNAVLESEELGMKSRVVGAYLDLLLASDNVFYSNSQNASVEMQLAQAEKRLKLGQGTITEVSEAEANLQTVRAQTLEWTNNLEFTKRALENITGIYTDIYFTLDASKLPLMLPEPANVDQWITTAMEKNADIRASLNDYLATTEEIKKNQSGHYPTLDLVASRTQTQSDNVFTIGSQFDTDSIGLQLNVPIYTGGYVSAAVRQAVSKAERAKEKLSEKQRQVTADVRKYFNEIVNGVARIEAYQQSVKSNEVALTGTKKGFKSGIRTNVEVLNAQEKLFSAKRELAKERYRLIYNRVSLKQVTGLLTETDIVEVNNMLAFQIE